MCIYMKKKTSEPVEAPQGQIVAVIIMGHDRNTDKLPPW